MEIFEYNQDFIKEVCKKHNFNKNQLNRFEIFCFNLRAIGLQGERGISKYRNMNHENLQKMLKEAINGINKYPNLDIVTYNFEEFDILPNGLPLTSSGKVDVDKMKKEEELLKVEEAVKKYPEVATEFELLAGVARVNEKDDIEHVIR